MTITPPLLFWHHACKGLIRLVSVHSSELLLNVSAVQLSLVIDLDCLKEDYRDWNI